jgi:polyhydroxyalkanoate synthase
LNLRKLPAPLAYAPGWVNVIGFKLMDPVSSIKGYLNLITQLENREYVEQHANQAAFIDNLEAYPGGVIRDWMASVWIENETSKGRFTVGHDVVHLDRVTANLLCIAGKKDNLTNIPCARGMMNVVSSVDKEFFIGPGGHIGIMGGRESAHTIWQKTADWLASRSGLPA